MSQQMTGRWYPVAIRGQRFIPIGCCNLSGYSSYGNAYEAMESYSGPLEPPYAIIFVENTFDRVLLDPVYKLQETAVDPWDTLST